MNILVLEPCPLISEMISMIIHRISPNARVTVTNTYKKFCTSAETLENIILAILEIESPGCHGLSGAEYITTIIPKAEILILTNNGEENSNEKYSERPNFHFLKKNSDIKEIRKKVQNIIFKNNSYLSNKDNSVHILKISKRHRQLLNMLNKGYRNAQISSELGITEHTVKVHFFRLYKILKINNRLQALHYARKHGWISDAE